MTKSKEAVLTVPVKVLVNLGYERSSSLRPAAAYLTTPINPEQEAYTILIICLLSITQQKSLGQVGWDAPRYR